MTAAAHEHPLVAAVRARGTNGLRSNDVRDAAHEAFHALSAGTTGKWEREHVHRALTKKFKRAELWVHEMQARAVEQVVCKRLGVSPDGDITKWVIISCFEAIKRGMPYCRPDEALPIAKAYLARSSTTEWADKIVALMEHPEPPKRK